MIKWYVFHEDIAILCTYKTDIREKYKQTQNHGYFNTQLTNC